MSFESITRAKLAAEALPNVRASISKVYGRDHLYLSAPLPSGCRVTRAVAANLHGFVSRSAVASALNDVAGAAASNAYLEARAP